MGKKIRFTVGDDISMFQVFKRYVHQTEKNEFYYDGTVANQFCEIPIDFRNLEHTYDVFRILGGYWGNWNECPTSATMYSVAKDWEESFGAEITAISHDSIDFKISRKLVEKEMECLIQKIKELHAEANYTGGFEKMKKCIREKAEFSIWWD